MNTEKLLQKIKTVAPDSNYTAQSRMLIVGETPRALPAFGVKEIFFNILNSGSAIALAAVLLLLAAGSFSLIKFFAPATTALLDPAGLRAGAQAIDIQIELANIAYQEPTLISETSSAPFAAKAKAVAPKRNNIGKELGSEAEKLGLLSPASSTSRISIDDALDALSR